MSPACSAEIVTLGWVEDSHPQAFLHAAWVPLVPRHAGGGHSLRGSLDHAVPLGEKILVVSPRKEVDHLRRILEESYWRQR